MQALGAELGFAVLSRLPPTLGSLSCQVDDAQSLVTQISSTANGKWPFSLTFVLQVQAYQNQVLGRELLQKPTRDSPDLQPLVLVHRVYLL